VYESSSATPIPFQDEASDLDCANSNDKVEIVSVLPQIHSDVPFVHAEAGLDISNNEFTLESPQLRQVSFRSTTVSNVLQTNDSPAKHVEHKRLPSPVEDVPEASKDTTDLRIDRILDYLRAVDHENHSIKESASCSTLPTVFDSVKARMITQDIELEEKMRLCDTLKIQIQRLKNAQQTQTEEHSKELKTKLNLQRKEYETTIKRHLTFIDKTLKEKESLATKCEQLASTVKSMENQIKEKMQRLIDNHDREIKSAKGVWEAAEKIKREKWMATQAIKIKEATVKGLEPEIQRMMAQHKTALAMMEERSQDLVQKERQILREQHEVDMQRLRDQMVADRSRACEEERELARVRYMKQAERDEIEFQQLRRKLTADFAEQQDLAQANFRSERLQAEANHKAALETQRREVDHERTLHREEMDELRRRHSVELNQQLERSRLERESWAQQYVSKLESEIASRERTFKENLLRERDAEIERIIARVETDCGASASDQDQRHRKEMEDLRSAHATELKQLKDQWQFSMDKIVELGRQVEAQDQGKADIERQLWTLRSTLDAKERIETELRRQLDRFKLGEGELRRQVGMLVIP
jgi:hypothetical protein